MSATYAHMQAQYTTSFSPAAYQLPALSLVLDVQTWNGKANFILMNGCRCASYMAAGGGLRYTPYTAPETKNKLGCCVKCK